MFRLAFWLLFGARRPHLDEIRHLSSPIIVRSAMTVLLHARTKEDFLLVMNALRVVIDRFDGQVKQVQAQSDNVRPLQTNGQNHQNQNNQRR